jgi:hypothetical protein
MTPIHSNTRIPFQMSSDRNPLVAPDGKQLIVHIAMNIEYWPYACATGCAEFCVGGIWTAVWDATYPRHAVTQGLTLLCADERASGRRLSKLDARSD